MSAIFWRLTSNNKPGFYCINSLHSFRTEDKLKKYKNVCDIYDYCQIETPKGDNEILKYNQGEKSMKAPFIIYAYLESLLEGMITCHNNLKIH